MRGMTTAAPRTLALRGCLLLAILLSGCAGQSSGTAAPTTTAPPATPAPAQRDVAQPTATQPAQRAATPPAATVPVRGSAPPTPAPPTAAPLPPTAAPEAGCEPTRADALGPFYQPNAPVRASVGQGYVLTGTVRLLGGCRPVPGARIEFWLANPQGEYDDAHRATVIAGPGGEYRFESNVPPPYGGRPPHVHLRVTAPGSGQALVTQHYPRPGQTEAVFDLVLAP